MSSIFIDLTISIMFILSLRGLAFPHSAYRSNIIGICGMIFAIIFSLFSGKYLLLYMAAVCAGATIGIFISQKIKMTSLPETVAAFNGLGGLAAFLISCCTFLTTDSPSFDVPVSAAIGIFTFSGSFIAFAKLHRIIKDNIPTIRPSFNIITIIIFTLSLCSFYINTNNFWYSSILACLLGITITVRIGGADMPIAISLLNAASGLASVAVGFIINNLLLVITGALVGISGSILSYIMSKAMNRSLVRIISGSSISQTEIPETEDKTIKSGTPSEAAFIMENANNVIIVPGYGMAVAQAQHSIKQMAELLSNKYKVNVKFAIHPVAGRMPGHMNVLLAEAGVPYENIYELNQINNDFSSADVAYVIGANDIVNPLAQSDTSSPIYGMPILNVNNAKTIFVVKRSLATGYSGIDNPLFYNDKTIMLFGDAQKVTAEIVSDLEH